VNSRTTAHPVKGIASHDETTRVHENQTKNVIRLTGEERERILERAVEASLDLNACARIAKELDGMGIRVKLPEVLGEKTIALLMARYEAHMAHGNIKKADGVLLELDRELCAEVST